MVLVVVGGEGPVDVLAVRRIDEEPPASRHGVLVECEIQGPRAPRIHAEPPEKLPVVQALPRPRGFRSDVDLQGRRVSQGQLPGLGQPTVVLGL